MNKKTFSQIRNIIKMSNQADKSFFIIVLLRSLASASLPFVSIIYSALLIDGFIQGLPKDVLMLYVFKLIIISGTLLLLRVLLSFIVDQKSQIINLLLGNEISKKTLNLDYQQLESQRMKNMLSSADQGVTSNGGLGSFILQIGRSIQHAISGIYSFVLMIGMFQMKNIENPSTIEQFFNSPIVGSLIIGIILLSLINNFISLSKQNKIQYETFTENVKINRIFQYFANIAFDYKLAKDIRIYNMDKLINKESQKYYGQFKRVFRNMSRKIAKKLAVITLVNNVVVYLAYILIGIKALLGITTVGAVLRLVYAVTAFNTSITQFASNFNIALLQTKYLQLYKDYLDEPTEMYKGTIPIEKRDDNKYLIEFKNVSFHYPNSEEMILKDFSIKLTIGERLAIVGPNGAGKTTMIKLICRLYDPTKGEILLNGVNIKKYNYEQYVKLFAIVFQDFKLFSTTIKNNVAFTQEETNETIKKYLYQAGLKDMINNLEEGIDTYLYTDFAEKGIEVSGGEAQKIAIARALYKDSPFVILDEPTSALDPVSEYEIYTKFDELVKNKTSIYISHRMASCRFCNNIIVIENGSVTQHGNHENLLQDKDGLYYTMWETQSQYYKEEV